MIFIAHICADILIAMLNLTGARFHSQTPPSLRLSEGRVTRRHPAGTSSGGSQQRTDSIGKMSIRKVQYLVYMCLFFFFFLEFEELFS